MPALFAAIGRFCLLLTFFNVPWPN